MGSMERERMGRRSRIGSRVLRAARLHLSGLPLLLAAAAASLYGM